MKKNTTTTKKKTHEQRKAPGFVRSVTLIDKSQLKWSSYKTEQPDFLPKEEFTGDLQVPGVCLFVCSPVLRTIAIIRQ